MCQQWKQAPNSVPVLVVPCVSFGENLRGKDRDRDEDADGDGDGDRQR